MASITVVFEMACVHVKGPILAQIYSDFGMKEEDVLNVYIVGSHSICGGHATIEVTGTSSS